MAFFKTAIDAVARAIVRRGLSGEVRAAWLEATGGGDVSPAGDVRLPEQWQIAGMASGPAAANGLRAIEGGILELGGIRYALRVCVAENGDVEFVHDSGPQIRFARMRSTAAPAAEGDFGFDADGRMQVYASGDTVTACDQSVPTFDDLLVVIRFEHPGDDVAYGSDPTASPAFIVTPPWPVDLKSLEMHILPKLELTADNTNYARIDLQQELISENLFCRCETRVSGGTHPTGDWSPAAVITPTMESYSPAYLEAGSQLVLLYDKFNAGVILPPHTVEIRAKRAGVH